MADSLARRYTGPKGYDDIGQLSAIENNNMSIYPLKLRPPPLKKKKEKFRAPKLTRVRLPHIVLDFNNRLRRAAMVASGNTGNIRLGLLRIFVQNDEDG
jgi:hypothetical protein